MMNNVEQIKSTQVILKLMTVLLVPMVNFHIRTFDKRAMVHQNSFFRTKSEIPLRNMILT